MLHLRLHNARIFKKNAPTGSQKRAAATPFIVKESGCRKLKNSTLNIRNPSSTKAVYYPAAFLFRRIKHKNLVHLLPG